jgi:hypothetical protein
MHWRSIFPRTHHQTIFSSAILKKSVGDGEHVLENKHKVYQRFAVAGGMKESSDDAEKESPDQALKQRLD